MKPSEESKYIQQHLANERTYLAWVRTAIAIIGLGFLTTTLHFNTLMGDFLDHTIAMVISLFSLIIGSLTLLLATFIYFRNRKTINSQRFHSSFNIVIYMTIIVFIIFMLFTIYYFFSL